MCIDQNGRTIYEVVQSGGMWVDSIVSSCRRSYFELLSLQLAKPVILNRHWLIDEVEIISQSLCPDE